MSPTLHSRQIRLIRLYDAPVQLVWEAWTDVDQVKDWWGPRGFSLQTHSKDLKEGGHWAYTMFGPDGTAYENKTKYLQVVPGSKLVYDHGGNDDRPPLFRVTVEFSELKNAEGIQTKMDMTMELPSAEAAQEIKMMIKAAGGESTWDRLAEYLDYRISKRQSFTINRSFEAPLETVFTAWTDIQQLRTWLAPSGTDMTILKGEIKPGGELFYSMGNESMTLYASTHYLKISKPTEVLYTQQFRDQNENLSKHPLAPTWPETMLTRIQFAPEENTKGSDQTRVTVTWTPHGEVSADEIETFVAARAGMTQGWTGSFDKLEAFLSKTRS